MSDDMEEKATVALLHTIDKKLDKLEVKLDMIERDYVTRAEFSPIQKIVYGLVGFIMISFLTAIAGLIFIKSSSAAFL